MDSDLAESVAALRAVFERRKLPFELGAADKALIEEIRKHIRLPSRFRTFLLEANPVRVEAVSPVERVKLFSAAELLEEQKGFALDDALAPRVDAKDGWKKSWIIIGRSTLLGDPYFLDVGKMDAEGDCPVYTAMSGTERWDARLCGSTFAQFLRIVATAMEIGAGFGEAIMDDDDEASFREALGARIKPIDPAATRAGHWN